MFIDKCKKITLTTSDGLNIPVKLQVNTRAKRLILRIDRKERGVVAVAPSRQQLNAAKEFAKSRLDWIVSQLQTLRAPIELAEGVEFPLRGRPCRLTGQGPGRLPVLQDGQTQTLILPGAADTLQARALRYLKRAAKNDLTAAVAVHSKKLGVHAARITIRDTKSRWGSCSASGNLSFSWRLVLAPEHILSYVAAHEVAHLLEMNHSPQFWAQVERTYPNWRPARNWLRAHGRDLHTIGT